MITPKKYFWYEPIKNFSDLRKYRGKHIKVTIFYFLLVKIIDIFIAIVITMVYYLCWKNE